MQLSINNARFYIVKNALAVMLLGMLGGFAWAFSLLGEVSLSPFPFVLYQGDLGEPSRWRAVHIGCLLNGIMALVFSAVLVVFELTSEVLERLKSAVILTIWGNSSFYILAVFAPNHGLSLGDNLLGPSNFSGGLAYGAAMIAVFALLYIVVTLLSSPIRNGQGEQNVIQ